MDSISLGLYICAGFFVLQMYFFFDTQRCRHRFEHFFSSKKSYSTERRSLAQEQSTVEETDSGESFIQIVQIGNKKSDLYNLIEEINHYVVKTKGTTDFAVIQNKVERKLDMRYEQASAKISFPTYLGLMGTFLGVFIGISLFNSGFDAIDGITDTSIQNLLSGVLVSMFTSLIGLLLTTINHWSVADAKKKVEEDKNRFYDFVQTELMPSLDVSMVAALGRLHTTVDQFEPAFKRVIKQFQTTFEKCTGAFGTSFEKHVRAVANAVNVMGQNMDKINQNIDLQERLLEAIGSNNVAIGLQKYIEASEKFSDTTAALNRFEQARRMMLEAAQHIIDLQKDYAQQIAQQNAQYAESLKVPREMVVRVNQILDRIKTFESSVNRIGGQLDQREILGNDVVNAIGEQIKGISKKGKIADKYLEMADGKLEDLFQQQTAVIGEMNKRYRAAISEHIDNFEKMLSAQTQELGDRHKSFLQKMDENLSVEDVRQEFTNLRKLNEINASQEKLLHQLDEIASKLGVLSQDGVKDKDLRQQLDAIQSAIGNMKVKATLFG